MTACANDIKAVLGIEKFWDDSESALLNDSEYERREAEERLYEDADLNLFGGYIDMGVSFRI